MERLTLRIQKEHVFKILLLCFSTSAVLLLAEAVLQNYLPNNYHIWPPNLEKVFYPSQDVMPGVSGPSRFITSSSGIRGDELSPSNTYRILAIGGSTTECLYLDQIEAWPYLLQKTLNEKAPNHNVWVGNAGQSGRTTRHHLTAMQYLPLRERRIDAIILLIGINDFSRRLSEGENYDPNFLSKPGAADKLGAETFAYGWTHPNLPFYKKSAIWKMVGHLKKIAFPKKTERIVNDEAGKNYVTWRKNRQQAAEILDELPDLSSAIEEYSRNINMMVDLAQEKSVRLIFLTQPTLWKPGLPEELDALLWFGGIGAFQTDRGYSYYSAEALEKGMEKYNDALLQICRERQVECIDLSQYLEKNTTTFYDDVHFNESGARKVSGILSKHILSNSPF